MTQRIVIVCAAGVVLAVLASAPRSAAQTLGTVTGSTLQSCGNRNFEPNMTCYAATLTGCPGDDDLQFVYGVENPVGAVLGTIVMFDGGNGESASETPDWWDYVNGYVRVTAQSGYQVVQVAWGATNPGGGHSGYPWEETLVSPIPGDPNNSYNINTAACRPASFLNWVRYGGLWTQGGMCAQGRSAGSGALGYALAWYNAGSYLDKVVLEDGPIFSRIDQGCTISANGTNTQTTQICAPGQTQIGCQGWVAPFRNWSLEYTGGDQNAIEAWTGGTQKTGPACANNSVPTTYDSTWQKMSIVYFPTSGQQPSFSYPKTAISGWLCQTFVSGVVVTDAGAEGELFYLQFTSPSQVNALTVNAITNCPVSEGVEAGTPPTYTGESTGKAAIIKEMTLGTTLVPACSKLH